MSRIVFFPASHAGHAPFTAVTRTPVWKVDETFTFDERLGGHRHQFRLNLDPWDLLRVIAEAHRLGREGAQALGFGYDYEAHAIVMVPRGQGDSTGPRPPTGECGEGGARMSPGGT